VVRCLVPIDIKYMYGGAISDRRRPPLGGAGLFSTADDMARFDQLMLNDGVSRGRRILKHETVTELTRKQTGDLQARTVYVFRRRGARATIVARQPQLRRNPFVRLVAGRRTAS
jgi:CubicO group peptidase (beta-lactamase class C family)